MPAVAPEKSIINAVISDATNSSGGGGDQVLLVFEGIKMGATVKLNGPYPLGVLCGF